MAPRRDLAIQCRGLHQRYGSAQRSRQLVAPGQFSPARPGTATAVTNETIYLYSNIQGPGGTRAIWKVHGLGPVTMSDTLAMRATGSSATPTTADTDTTTDGPPIYRSQNKR